MPSHGGRPIEAALEDYVWGNLKEMDYLERVAQADVDEAESVLARVQGIDTDLNRELRKGVEENLSRLLEQTTALEGLERRQKNVAAQMDNVKEGCDRLAKSLAAQLDDFKEGVAVAQRIFTARTVIADALRCEELMEQFEKRAELVKRSEIICEMRAIVAESPKLGELAWLRPTIGEKMKKAVSELQSSSAAELRRGLETLNASTVTSAKRALANLGSLDGELEQVAVRAVATLDSAFLELASAPASAPALLPTAINGVQAHLEQATLLGEAHLTKFCERLARTMRARVPVDAPYALRLVQSLSRILASRPASPALVPLGDAMRPLKHAILSQSLTRLHTLINQHDLATTAPNSSRFVEVLNTSLEEELRLVEWDPELRVDAAKNIAKCIDLVGQKIEAALRLDADSLLLGDRLSSAQHANYRLLESAHSLAGHWPAHAEPLHRVHSEATSLMVTAVRDAIATILATLHREAIGGGGGGARRDCSAYMQELAAYLGRVGMHAAHAPSSLGRSDVLSSLCETTLAAFLVHASLVRPLDAGTRRQLRSDLVRLLGSLDELGTPVGLAPFAARADEEGDGVLARLFTCESNEMAYPLAPSSSTASSSSSVPPWLFIHFLIQDSPPDLMSPQDSVQYTKEEYARWVLEQADSERLKLLSGLLDAYTGAVVQKGSTTYVPNYPRIVEILDAARKRTTTKG